MTHVHQVQVALQHLRDSPAEEQVADELQQSSQHGFNLTDMCDLINARQSWNRDACNYKEFEHTKSQSMIWLKHTQETQISINNQLYLEVLS